MSAHFGFKQNFVGTALPRSSLFVHFAKLVNGRTGLRPVEIGLCLLLLGACKPPPDGIIGPPDLMNAPFEASYSDFKRMVTANPGKHPDWAHNADSLYYMIRAFSLRTATVRKDLLDKDHYALDSRLTDRTLAQKTLTHTPLGDSLRLGLSAVVECCYHIMLGHDSKWHVDLDLGDTKENTQVMKWNSTFFHRGTWDAASQLGNFTRDCEQAATGIFEEMSKRF